jgi:hypothetical protein
VKPEPADTRGPAQRKRVSEALKRYMARLDRERNKQAQMQYELPLERDDFYEDENDEQ